MQQPEQPNGKRVLVVDDDTISLWIVGLALMRRGFKVSAIADGDEAIAELGRSEYDMLITDVQMPHVDGLTLLDWVARHRPGLRSMVITAHATPAVRETCLARGAVLFMQKPVDNTLLCETVKHYTSLERGLQAPKSSMDKLVLALEEAATVQTGGEVLVRSLRNVGRAFFVKDELAWTVIASESTTLMEHLVQNAGVSRDDLKAAFAECRHAGGNYAEILVHWGLVDAGRMRVILLEQIAINLRAMGSWPDLVALFAPHQRTFAGSFTFPLPEVFGAIASPHTG